MTVFARLLAALLPGWTFWMVELYGLPEELITVVLLIELPNPQAFHKSGLFSPLYSINLLIIFSIWIIIISILQFPMLSYFTIPFQ